MENVKVRMCVVCRQRFKQNSLNRLQCRDDKLIHFSGVGRSFYVCKDCINNKKFIKFIAKMCNKSKEDAKKEILHFPFYIVN